MSRNKEVAKTIIDQLGGPMFIMMTGSKNFVAIDDGVQFTVGSGAEYGVNKMRIVLTPEDAYDISAMSVDNVADVVEEKCAISRIHHDQLKDAFYSCTGFVCSMGHRPINFFHTGNQLEDSPNLASPKPDPVDVLDQSEEKFHKMNVK